MPNANNLTNLAKEIYGNSDKRVKELEQMYNATQIEIEGIISQFVSDEDNWNTPAPKKLKQRFMKELQDMYRQAGGDDRSLIAVSMNDRKTSTVSDIVKVGVGIALIKLAQKRRTQLADTLQAIPKEVNQTGAYKARQQARKRFIKQFGRAPTPIEHASELARKYPARYHKPLAQEAISKMVKQFGSGIDTNAAINQNTVALMNKMNGMVDDILKNHRKPQDYSRDFTKLLTGGKSKGKGALSSAERLLRTESAYTFANSLQDDYKARGVKYFTNQANLGKNTCKFCERMDGKTFKVKDMQPGVNCFPFHPNCQCDIIESTEEDIKNSEF